nr:hypothetical protein [Tanacetum cinerariifolium]
MLKRTESYAEQAFWSQYSVQTDEPTHSGTTIVEVPKELPKVSMDLFTSFDQYLIDEVSEVQKTFKQMEMAVEQNCAAKSEFQSKMETVLKENDLLLKHALSVDIVNIVVDVVPLVPKLRKNRTAHIDYLKHTLEEAATLREIVESERLLRTKPVAVTPKNQNQQIRSTPQITKSGKPSVDTSTSPNIDSNTPVLSSIGVALASSASGS